MRKAGIIMKAKKGKRYGSDRTALQDVIPLDTPYLLFVDPSSLCNFKCDFCPCGGAHKDLWSSNKKPGILTYEVYRKVIDDLKDFPHKLKTLRLYKEGEPLINKRLPDMIEYARKNNVTDKIDFTTNGSLFDRDLSLAITDAGVDRINISIEALDTDGYRNFSGISIDYTKLLDNLKFLFDHKNGAHIFIKISDVGLGKHTEDEFYNMFGDICDEIAVEKVSPVWPGFDMDKSLRIDNAHDIYGADMSNRKEVRVCPYLFYSVCVNSDGTVSACLMDWNHQIIVGDVRKQSLKDIWNGSKMKEMRIDHLMLNKEKYSPCNQCGQLRYAVLDDIDPYRQSILNRVIDAHE